MPGRAGSMPTWFWSSVLAAVAAVLLLVSLIAGSYPALLLAVLAGVASLAVLAGGRRT